MSHETEPPRASSPRFTASSSIIRSGHTFRGIGVVDRGVFTDRGGKDIRTLGRSRTASHAGWAYSCPTGHGCTQSMAPKGATTGGTWTALQTGYILFERGVRKQQAWVWADGVCEYNDEECARNDPRLLALMAHVATVEAPASDAAKSAVEAVVSELAGGLHNVPSGLLRICDAITH
jgi:hypothetical protein